MSRRKRLTCKTPAARGAHQPQTRSQPLTRCVLPQHLCRTRNQCSGACNVCGEANPAAAAVLRTKAIRAQRAEPQTRSQFLARCVLPQHLCRTRKQGSVACNVCGEANPAAAAVLRTKAIRAPRAACHAPPQCEQQTRSQLHSGGQMYRAPGVLCRSICAPHAKTGDPLPNLPGRPYFPDPAIADRMQNNPYISA